MTLPSEKPNKSHTSAELASLAPGPECSYEQLQFWMTDVIRHARSPQSHDLLVAAMNTHFQDNQRISAAKQIDLYRRQFWLRHTSSLIEDFPGLTRHLGQIRWEKLVESFLTEVAPDSRFLGKVGRQLPQFIKESVQANDRLLCFQLAELELSYQQVFEAADRRPFDFTSLNDLSESDWLKLRFEVNPALILLRQNYAVTGYRRALLGEKKASLPKESERFVIVYRLGERLWDREVSAPCFLLLEALKEGLDLGQACDKVVDIDIRFTQILEQEVTGYFEQFRRLGWLSDAHKPKKLQM